MDQGKVVTTMIQIKRIIQITTTIIIITITVKKKKS